MQELVYSGKDVEKLVKDKWPSSKTKDASDEIHIERFELEIPDMTEDEFYPFAIKEGFARCCLSFVFLLESLKFPESRDHPGEHKETKEKIEKWITLAKGVHNANTDTK